MKAIRVFISMVVICGIAIAHSMFFAKEHTTAVIICRDETEHLHTTPEWVKIEARLGLHDIWQAIDICYLIISDSRLPEIEYVRLPVGNSWDNELERRSTVQSFREAFAGLSERSDSSAGRDYSSVYVPLSNQLSALSVMDAERREAYIYSDLMENTGELSLYDPSVKNHYRAHPEELKRYFMDLQSLGNLSGTTIYLLHEPKTVQADTDFAFISGIYKEMLEASGATVFISRKL